MKNSYAVFEHFSYAANVGVQVINLSGETTYASPLFRDLKDTMHPLLQVLDCAQAEHMALLYGCYQARRFGGRYTFLAPSGLAYCASPLLDRCGMLTGGVVAGPFLMTDHDEYLSIDVIGRRGITAESIEPLKTNIASLPCKPPIVARAISEQLFLCVTHAEEVAPTYPLQMDALAYPLDKEDALLDAVSCGNLQEASALLNDVLGQVLFRFAGDFETLRSRVFELIILLSRAALRGGANTDAIFGLNYAYLQEIDSLSGIEDMVSWLHSVTRRFVQHVFDQADTKHTGVISKAMAYIKANYAQKITLQDMADQVFLSPTYFSKLFKDETGQTPGSFLTAIRLEAGKRLLRDHSLPIVDIPEMVGFDNQSYFTRVFKKAEGQTPSQYRRQT